MKVQTFLNDDALLLYSFRLKGKFYSIKKFRIINFSLLLRGNVFSFCLSHLVTSLVEVSGEYE